MSNFVTSFVVGKSGGGANVGASLETIKKGDILVVDYQSGAVLTGVNNTVDTSPVIALAHCIEDGVPIISGPIYGQKLIGGSREAYSAPVLTKKAIGYSSTATTEALPALSKEEVFNVGIVLKTDLRLHANKQDRIDMSVVSRGGYDLARKIVNQMAAPSDINPKIPGNQLIEAFVTTDGTATVIGTDATATVTKGLKGVTFSDVHGLTAGAYVYFPNGGVYLVADVPSTKVITLDAAYAGESEVYAKDTVKEQKNAAGFGVQFNANEIKRTNPVDQYGQLDFEIGLSDNFNTTVSIVATYSPGVGTGWQVRDKEVATLGWAGYTDRRDTMRAEYPFQSDLNKNYLTVNISSLAPVRGDFYKTEDAPQATFIAFDNAAATQSTAVLAILTPWAASGGVDISA